MWLSPRLTQMRRNKKIKTGRMVQYPRESRRAWPRKDELGKITTVQSGDARPGSKLPSSALGSTLYILVLNTACLTKPSPAHQACSRQRATLAPLQSFQHTPRINHLVNSPRHTIQRGHALLQELLSQAGLPEPEVHQPDINSLPLVWQG